ncbi:MAG: hypothetical protein ACXAC2_00715 [Candidatus Kariarchaeaceae archaeon]|jgi:nitric oxide reductase large subunit
MSEEFVLILVNMLLVPLLVQLYKFLVSKVGWKPGKLHISIVLSAVAVSLSYFFGEDFFASLPPFSENFFEWLVAFVDGLGALLGASVLLYNAIADKFFDGIRARFVSFGRRLLGK